MQVDIEHMECVLPTWEGDWPRSGREIERAQPIHGGMYQWIAHAALDQRDAARLGAKRAETARGLSAFAKLAVSVLHAPVNLRRMHG